ncbi:MAG: glycosyl transferase [Bacilli bacterium]|nr:glycosyl transferase [Bacilli bacterium]
MRAINSYLRKPSQILRSSLRKYGKYLPDKYFLKWTYYMVFGYYPDLNNPQTYNEKLQWLKLNERKPLMSRLVDKIEVKEWVAKKIGKKYIIPTIGVWDHPTDIALDTLPSKFVLKTNHDSGGLYICKDKNKAKNDWLNICKRLQTSLDTDYYKIGREWPYKNVNRKILAEQFIETDDGEVSDYKFFCFNGEPKFLFVATERQKEGEDVKFDFYDLNYTHLPVKQGHENARTTPHKPEQFEEMVKLAKVLSEGFIHVRVDFYNVNERVYFGEMTFFHNSGFVPFTPPEWDKRFGDMIQLPEP